ncbi:MAG: hypothetical protein ABIP48_17905 [Planctomycetota bacterium]
MADDVVRYPWYGAVSGPDLEQGDILLDCPVFLIPPDAVRQPGDHAITIERQRQNVIVMTQSCDLAVRRDGKCNADDVILAALYSRHELKKDKHFGKLHGWEQARKGGFPRYHVLNQCGIPGHELDYMLVDLERVFTLSADAVREVAAAEGKDRVRLLPPYREHLSQAFARFFMRVGLPVDIPPFK